MILLAVENKNLIDKETLKEKFKTEIGELTDSSEILTAKALKILTSSELMERWQKEPSLLVERQVYELTTSLQEQTLAMKRGALAVLSVLENGSMSLGQLLAEQQDFLQGIEIGSNILHQQQLKEIASGSQATLDQLCQGMQEGLKQMTDMPHAKEKLEDPETLNLVIKHALATYQVKREAARQILKHTADEKPQ